MWTRWTYLYYVTWLMCRMSRVKIATKEYTQNAKQVHYCCTQNTVATKVNTFPLPDYIFDICKPWTKFLAKFT